jgi:primase-polymerase (primpol)-like protein
MINWDAVPGFLIARPQWLLWRYEWREQEGKWSKPPLQLDHRMGSSTDANSWVDWETVQVTYDRDTEDDKFFDGIGFALTADLGLVGWDFDHCYDPATGKIDPIVARYLAILNSYTELTPGGDGFRVLVLGTLPPEGRKRPRFPTASMACECYVAGRYLTITGHRFDYAK